MADFNNLNPNLIFDFNRLVPGGLNYASFVLRQNPLMYLRFQESAGLTAFDTSTNGTNGTLTSTGITRGVASPLTRDARDTAIELDGVDGFITVTSNAALNQAFTQFAVDCWIKVDALPASEEVLVSRGTNVGTNNFQLSLLPDGRIKFWYNDSASAKIATSPSVISPGEFVYILANWDGTTNAVFLNGVRGDLVANVPAPALGTENVQIGAYNNGQRFDGVIDEVALYGDGIDIDAGQRTDFNNDANSAPVISSSTANGFNSGTVNIFEGESVTFVLSATDPDEDPLTYSFSPDGFTPSVGPQASNTTVVQYLETGVYSPVGFVTDGQANRSRAFPTINVDPVPDLNAFSDFFGTGYRQPRTLNVLSNDSFPPGGLGSINSFTQPANGTVALQGSGESASFLYTPDDTFQDADDTFTYEITNGSGALSQAVVTVSVAAKKPIQTATDRRTISPDTTVTFSPQSNDRPDPPSQTLTVVDVQTPTPEGGSAVVVGNQVQYTPAPGFLGTDTFVYQVQDEDGLLGDGTIIITVKVIQFEAISDSAVCPFEGSVTFGVLGNDTTPFPDPLSVSAITQPPVGEGAAVLNVDDTITYTAPAGFAGTTSFTYTLDDGTRTDVGAVSVRVNNFSPSAVNFRVSAPLDTPREVDPLATATDPEGEVITLTGFTQPSAGVVTRVEGGTPGDLSDDRLLYTPNPGFVGLDSYTYTISDTFGNSTVRTVQVVISYTLNISVSPLSLPVTEVITFSASVTGATGFDKSYTYFWDFGGAGTSTARSGSFQFPGVGTYVVTCTTRDSYGQIESAQVTVQVGANQAPVASDLSVTVAEGEVLNVDPRSNDFDPDGDLFFVSNADPVSAQGGTVSINVGGNVGSVYDDFISYVHPLLATPFVDSFDYEITDEFGLTDTATITVTIEANQAPVALPIFQPVIFQQAAVLNPIALASDPEGDPLKIVSVDSVGVEGNTSLIGTGINNTILFTPATGFLGVATFDFTIEDTFGNRDTSQASVSIFGQFYPALVFGDEPLAYYPLNEASGARAYDVRPLQAHGSYINGVPRDTLGYLAKDLENAARVDSGYVSLPTLAYRNLITGPLTIEMWVNVRAPGASAILGDEIQLLEDGTYSWTLTTTGGTKSLQVSGREVGEPYHLVLTYDGSWMRIYIDGSQEASTPYSGGAALLPTTWDLGRGMQGIVSDFAVYDRALLVTDVLAHYLEALGPVTEYEITAPNGIVSGGDFDLRVRARDVTGKLVTTDSTTQVLMSSDQDVEFDSDGDGTFGEV